MVKQIAHHFFHLSTLMLVLLSASTAASSSKATGLFYPCQSSTSNDNIFSVVCNNITGKRVKTAFEKSKIYRIDQFVFNLKNSKVQSIPANVIGNHSIGKITLHCPGKNSPLRIYPSAFSLTKLYTDTLNISNCNLQYLNWSFLKGFSNLSSIHIVGNSSNLHQRFHTLPTRTLTKLKIFHLDSVLGLNGFNHTSLKFPPPPKGITEITIDNCYDVGTAALENLLKQWVTAPAAATLRTLSLSNNSLTRIPPLSHYVLLNVKISGNLQPLTIPSGSFYLLYLSEEPPYYQHLDLSNSQITSISPEAFQGSLNAQDPGINLSGNKLERLDSNAFSSSLFMFYVHVNVEDNPFDCVKNQCSLAWLILKNRGDETKCSNGTLFNDLDIDNLRYPNGTKCL